jgi:hypothetical protein
MNAHVLATFTRRSDADEALARVRQQFPGLPARPGDREDELDALAIGQRAEMDADVPVVAVGFMSGSLARGALIGAVIGAVVGIAVAVPFALLAGSTDTPRPQLALWFGLAGALAVGTVGAVLGAGRQAVREGETTPQDPTAVVRVDSPAEQAKPVIAVLVEAGARSARYVDQPVPRRSGADVETPHGLPEATAPGSRDRRESDAGFGSASA